MKTIKVLTVLILISLFLSSCNNDDTLESPPANLGIYTLKSFQSNVAMDLDYDGVASVDFKEELQLWWFTFPNRSRLYHLEILPSPRDGKYLLITDGMPRDDHDDRYPDPHSRFKQADGIHALFIRNNEIISYEFQEPFVDRFDPNVALGQQRPYFIQFDSDHEITMKLTQYFYDYISDEWIQVDLLAKFDKIIPQ